MSSPRSRTALSWCVLLGAVPAQDGAATATVVSRAPDRTAALLERLGFESRDVDGAPVVQLHGLELRLLREPENSDPAATAPLGSAARPLQVTVADVEAARERLQSHRPLPEGLVASPSGASSLRVEAPGGVVLILRAGADASPDAVVVPRPGELNELVLEVLAAYPTDGTHDYHWPKSGTWKGCTKDLEYAGELLAEGDPQGRAYCCGLTFEVFLDAWRLWCQRSARPWRIRDLDLDGVRRLHRQWFGSAEDPSCLHTALVAGGLGTRVTDWEDARPGDFVQVWRVNGSGHSVVFLGWERNGRRITGMRYWSTQRSTRGIGERTEWFGERGGARRLDPERIWICRVGMPPTGAPRRGG